MHREGIHTFEVPVPASLDGLTLAQSGIGARTGITVVGIERDGEVDTAIGPSTKLAVRETLIAIGSTDHRKALAQLIDGGA